MAEHPTQPEMLADLHESQQALLTFLDQVDDTTLYRRFISLGEMRRKSYSPEGARKESCPSSRCKKGKSNDGGNRGDERNRGDENTGRDCPVEQRHEGELSHAPLADRGGVHVRAAQAKDSALAVEVVKFVLSRRAGW